MIRQLDRLRVLPSFTNSTRNMGRLVSRPPKASFQDSRNSNSIEAVVLPIR